MMDLPRERLLKQHQFDTHVELSRQVYERLHGIPEFIERLIVWGLERVAAQEMTPEGAAAVLQFYRAVRHRLKGPNRQGVSAKVRDAYKTLPTAAQDYVRPSAGGFPLLAEWIGQAVALEPQPRAHEQAKQVQSC